MLGSLLFYHGREEERKKERKKEERKEKNSRLWYKWPERIESFLPGFKSRSFAFVELPDLIKQRERIGLSRAEK